MSALRDTLFSLQFYCIAGFIFSSFHIKEAVTLCEDLDLDCAHYGHDYICQGDYLQWATIHCKKYCNLCAEATSVGPTALPLTTKLTQLTSTTAQSPSNGRITVKQAVGTEAVTLCTDLDPDCADYGHQYICQGDYLPWSTIHCKKYCNLCTEGPITLYQVVKLISSFSLQIDIIRVENTKSHRKHFVGTIPSVTKAKNTKLVSTTTTTTRSHSTSRITVKAAAAGTGQTTCPSQVIQRVPQQNLYQYGERCYEFVPSNESWVKAREDCHRKGGHMLSIDNAGQQTFIVNLLTNIHSVSKLWLGLDDRVNEGQWNWDSGETVNYTNWAPGRYVDPYHDQEDCALIAMARHGQWDDVDCNAIVHARTLSYPWICQYNRRTNVSSSTSPVSASWSSWFSGACSVTCGTGTTSRLRRCSTGHEPDCVGKAFEVVACDAGPCPIDGSWNSWQHWSTCSATCGDGKQTRTRICDNPAPQNGGVKCNGPRNDTSICNLADCPHWLPYYEAASCSVTCGVGFIQLRRNCSSGNLHGCSGSAYNEKPCTLMACS